MAVFTFKTTLEYADGLCDHKRMFDIREKTKHINVGDIIQYIPWYKGKAVKGHGITEKRFRVIHVDREDPRVMTNFDIFQMEEVEPDFK